MSGIIIRSTPYNPLDPGDPSGVPGVVQRILSAFYQQEQGLFQRLMALRAAEKNGGEQDDEPLATGTTTTTAADRHELPYELAFPVGEWTVLAFWRDEGHFFCQLDGHFRGVWNGQKLEYSISIDLPGPGGRMGWE